MQQTPRAGWLRIRQLQVAGSPLCSRSCASVSCRSGDGHCIADLLIYWNQQEKKYKNNQKHHSPPCVPAKDSPVIHTATSSCSENCLRRIFSTVVSGAMKVYPEKCACSAGTDHASRRRPDRCSRETAIFAATQGMIRTDETFSAATDARLGRASAIAWNKQEEEHKDDEKHNSPPRISAKRSVHRLSPLHTRHIVSYVCGRRDSRGV